jgi:thiosulfate sulfurtransferase
MTRYKRIDAFEAKKLIDNRSMILVDVRDKESFDMGHDSRAYHLTYENLPSFIENTPKNQPLFIICHHGNYSLSIAQYLVIHGFEEVYSIDGGYGAWLAAENVKIF